MQYGGIGLAYGGRYVLIVGGIHCGSVGGAGTVGIVLHLDPRGDARGDQAAERGDEVRNLHVESSRLPRVTMVDDAMVLGTFSGGEGAAFLYVHLLRRNRAYAAVR